MVKDPDPEPPIETVPIDYREIAKVVTRSVSTVIATYVTADIVRRVVIYAVSAKF